MTLSLPEHVTDVVFAGSDWQIKTCRICRQAKFVGREEHHTCVTCQEQVKQGVDPHAIADQMAARIGYMAIRDGINPELGSVSLGWDGRWHYIGR